MNNYTLTTDDQGPNGKSVIESIRKQLDDGVFEGRKFPLNVSHCGITVRIEVKDATSTEDPQGAEDTEEAST